MNPMVWVVALLLFSLFTRKKKLARKSFLVGIISLLFFSNSLIYNEIIRLWEVDATTNTELKQTYDYGIVLSGMTHFNDDLNRMNYLRSSDRIWQAVRLYEEGYIDKLLITGGLASLFSRDTVESVLLANYLYKIGIPKEDVLVEKLAKNTFENAVFTAKMLDTIPYHNLLLITSASHMPRSNACFKKAGLSCDLFPTDHYTKARSYDASQIIVPSAEALNNWVALLHEWFGMLSYKIAGYI